MRRVVSGVSGILSDPGTPPPAVDVLVVFSNYQIGGDVLVGRTFPSGAENLPVQFDLLIVPNDQYQDGQSADSYDQLAVARQSVPFNADDFAGGDVSVHVDGIPAGNGPDGNPQFFRVVVVTDFPDATDGGVPAPAAAPRSGTRVTTKK